MAFFRNDAVNRVNLHSGIQALAQSGGGVFFVVFLLRVGLSVPAALSALAAIMAVRFMLRPAILPLARRCGLKPLLILGTIGLAFQYPLLAEVEGVGGALAVLCLISAFGEIFYWPTYNAYFAAIGDAEHRGQQVGVREALSSVAGVLAPLLGAWALVTFGPRPMFAAVGLVQALAARAADRLAQRGGQGRRTRRLPRRTPRRDALCHRRLVRRLLLLRLADRPLRLARRESRRPMAAPWRSPGWSERSAACCWAGISMPGMGAAPSRLPTASRPSWCCSARRASARRGSPSAPTRSARW